MEIAERGLHFSPPLPVPSAAMCRRYCTLSPPGAWTWLASLALLLTGFMIVDNKLFNVAEPQLPVVANFTELACG